jgi:hypothetical protein
MVKNAFYLAPRTECFSSHGLSQTFHHFKIVLFVDSIATRQKFMLNNTFTIKEEYSRTLPSHLTEIAVLFWEWVKF